MRFSLVLVSLLMASSSLSAQTTEPQSFETEIQMKVGYNYLLSKPEGYGVDATKKWPLVIFLHGAGERGDNLELLKIHGPPKLLAAGKKIEAIVASPQVPSGSVWNPYAVKALVDELVKTQRVDTNRIYLTGISMGGFGSWDTLFEFPDLFAAVVPVCGGAGVKFVMADRIKHVPIWMFHGDKDPVVSPDYSQKMYDVLTKLKAPVKLTMYPGVSHNSWTATYDDPAMWEWLFQQTKAK